MNPSHEFAPSYPPPGGNDQPQGIPPSGDVNGSNHRGPPGDMLSPRGRRSRSRDRGRGRDRDRGRGRDRDRGRGSPRGKRRSPEKDRRRRRRSSSSSDSSSSPPRRRKKEKTGWDQPPAAVVPGAPMPGSAFMAAPSLAVAAPPMMPGVHPSRLAQMNAKPLLPMDAGASGAPPMLGALGQQLANQATRQARRLYVGNLPPETTEDHLKAFFNDAMLRANPVHEPGDSVISVYLNLPKKFGFVEFRSMEEAHAAMELDGIRYVSVLGVECILKIRRPSDYNAAIAPVPDPSRIPKLDVSRVGLTPSATGASTSGSGVIDSNNKLFCGGLPYDLSEQDVRELLQVYGAIKSIHLVRDKDSVTHKGYCFYEYVDPSVVEEAIKGLNGIPIGNKTLTVRRAQTRNDASAAMAAAPVLPINPLAINPSLLSTLQPTRVVSLLEMVTLDELKDDQEYRDIVEDVHQECRKYGNVVSVVIPRPVEGKEVRGLGKIFVQFNQIEEAMRAKQALEGRKFAQRTVLAQFWNEDAFARQEF